MTKWPTAPLETLTDPWRPITYGVVKPGDERPTDGILFIRGGDIFGGRVNVAALRTIAHDISRQYRRTLLRGGELVVSLVGYPGEVAIVPPELAGANLARQVGLVALKLDVDTAFVKYALMAPSGRAALLIQTTGTAQQVINLANLKKVPIPIPPLPIQRRIGSILGAYDDLIEMNRRRIAVLEEIARRLFDEWFVNFRFPGHEMVEIEKGGLPAGWRRAPIKDAYLGLFDGPHATPAPADDGAVFLGIGNITETGRLDLSSVRHIAEEEFTRWTKRVTPGPDDIVFTYEATLNRYALIPEGFRGCLGRRLALVRANSAAGHSLYLYLYFFTSEWRELIAANTLSGATVDRIPLSRFPEFPITLPPDDLILEFHRIAWPAIKQIQKLENVNTNLRAQRDLLLPRLISGELSVATAERELEDAA